MPLKVIDVENVLKIQFFKVSHQNLSINVFCSKIQDISLVPGHSPKEFQLRGQEDTPGTWQVEASHKNLSIPDRTLKTNRALRFSVFEKSWKTDVVIRTFCGKVVSQRQKTWLGRGALILHEHLVVLVIGLFGLTAFDLFCSTLDSRGNSLWGTNHLWSNLLRN